MGELLEALNGFQRDVIDDPEKAEEFLDFLKARFEEGEDVTVERDFLIALVERSKCLSVTFPDV